MMTAEPSLSFICNVNSLMVCCKTCGFVILLWVCCVAGPLTSDDNDMLYQVFTIRFRASRSLAVKSGYYADWVITERTTSAPADNQCPHCHNYCYHGYKYAAESCSSSCQCIVNVTTGMCSLQLLIPHI